LLSPSNSPKRGGLIYSFVNFTGLITSFSLFLVPFFLLPKNKIGLNYKMIVVISKKRLDKISEICAINFSM